MTPMTAMTIDCDSCRVRGLHCDDCVVTALLGPLPEHGFDDEDARALTVLSDAGLVPPLRMAGSDRSEPEEQASA